MTDTSLLCLQPRVVFQNEQATTHCQAADTQEDGTECKLIRGISSIFLDKDAGLAQEAGYTAIESVLNRTTFLSGLTGFKLVRSAFVSQIGENLVILSGDDEGGPRQDEDSSNLPTIIAIAAALISFILTAVFLYGLYRKHRAELCAESVKARVAHMQAKRRHYFQTLEDDSHGLEPGWMTTEADIPPPLPNSSITWSVSDLTSDSQSIKSSLRMDRIEEEGPFDQNDDYDIDNTNNDDQEGPSSSPGSPAEEEKVEIDLEPLGEFNFEACFDDPASEASTTKACNHDEQALLQEAVETSMMTLEDDNVADDTGQTVEDPNSVTDELESSTQVQSNCLQDCEPATPVLHGCQFLLEDGNDEEDSLNTSSQSGGSSGDPSLLMQMTTPLKAAADGSDMSSWSDFLTPQQEDEDKGSAPKTQTNATTVEPSTLEKSYLSYWDVLSWWMNLVMELERSRRIPRLTYHRNDEHTEG